MANSQEGNVIYCDTTATFANAVEICSIKYIGAASGTAAITSASGSKNIWEEAGTANVYNAEVDLFIPGGVTVTLANSAKVYLYLRR